MMRRQLEDQLSKRFALVRSLMSLTTDNFARSAPSAQNAVDAVADSWASRLPAPFDEVRAGRAELFEDARMTWAFERLGGLERKRILELGPLEGGHSYMAEKAGADHVLAIEANAKGFLKCLVTKELLGLSRCSFRRGDAIAYLSSKPERFDVCIACGILYHMQDPVKLIDLISRHANQLVVWTHFYNQRALQDKPIGRRLGPAEDAQHNGFHYRFHRHRYGYERLLSGDGYCGGTEPYSRWLPRDDLLRCLAYFGWQSVELGFEDLDHPDGPAIALVASRAEQRAANR